MDKKERLKKFSNIFVINNPEIVNDLAKLKSIEDAAKKYWEASRMFDKYKLQKSYMSEHYNMGEL